jgi:hypothetical protein
MKTFWVLSKFYSDSGFASEDFTRETLYIPIVVFFLKSKSGTYNLANINSLVGMAGQSVEISKGCKNVGYLGTEYTPLK